MLTKLFFNYKQRAKDEFREEITEDFYEEHLEEEVLEESLGIEQQIDVFEDIVPEAAEVAQVLTCEMSESQAGCSSAIFLSVSSIKKAFLNMHDHLQKVNFNFTFHVSI